MQISAARSQRHIFKTLTTAFTLTSLLFVFPAVSTAAATDEGKTLNVCVPQHTAKDPMLSQVANTLSHHKPDKNTRIRLQGVQLANVDQILVTDNPFKGNQAKQTLSSELRDRAVQEHCDYVLVVSLPDVSTARSPQPNVVAPNQQSTTSTYDPYMRRQDPDNYVRVIYKLYARDSATPPVDGFVTAHDSAPYQAVVFQALDLLANQVFTKLAK
jgi:hypothetical protein